MIITVTLNPAMDKTIDIAQLEQGTLNRVTHVENDAGGKGINVSKTIAALGGKSVATGFIAGHTGEMIRQILSDMGMEHDFIEITGETRNNIKIVESTGEVTELNEPGPKVEAEEVKALLHKLEEYANADTLFILAGSIPGGVDTDIYRQMIELVHKKGAKVLLDADGEAFARAVEAGPDMAKPNWDELMMYIGKYDTWGHHPVNLYTAKQTIQRVRYVADILLQKGMETLVVSMGAEGALFLKKDCEIRCPGLKVEAHSTVGAGDAMVAALAYGWEEKLPIEEIAKLAMAASAGAVMTIGTKPPTREMVDSLLLQVELT